MRRWKKIYPVFTQLLSAGGQTDLTGRNNEVKRSLIKNLNYLYWFLQKKLSVFCDVGTFIWIKFWFWKYNNYQRCGPRIFLFGGGGSWSWSYIKFTSDLKNYVTNSVRKLAYHCNVTPFPKTPLHIHVPCLTRLI